MGKLSILSQFPKKNSLNHGLGDMCHAIVLWEQVLGNGSTVHGEGFQ